MTTEDRREARPLEAPYDIEACGVSFAYGHQEVLHDVTLRVRRGDFLAVLGPNGGGKTTLLKVLLGILKPREGEVRVLGLPPERASRRVGYVPQDTDRGRDFPISVMEVALMGRLGRLSRLGRYTAEDRAAAEAALRRLQMWELRGRPIGALSGGQRQRVFIARAIAADPQILFLDEPTASVDQEGQTRLYELLRELNEKMTILVVSHDLSMLSSCVKSVACVNRSLYFHESPEITPKMLEMAASCPVELVTHGHLPHRVLGPHGKDPRP